MIDYLWHGDPEAIATVAENQLNVIGPRVLDGIAYVNIRTDDVLTPPEGVEVTGPQLSEALLGVWA